MEQLSENIVGDFGGVADNQQSRCQHYDIADVDAEQSPEFDKVSHIDPIHIIQENQNQTENKEHCAGDIAHDFGVDLVGCWRSVH